MDAAAMQGAIQAAQQQALEAQNAIVALQAQHQEQMQQLQVQLQAQVQAANDQAAAAQAQAAAAAQAVAAAPVAAPPHRIKIPKPPVHTGKQGELPARTWLFTTEQYFVAEGLTDERRMVQFAASLLEGRALRWWEGYLLSHDYPTTWPTFRDALLSAEQHIDPVRYYRDRLRLLEQTGSVQEYVDAFDECRLQIPGITDDECLDRFVDKLKKPLKKELLKDLSITTYAAAVKMAQRLEAQQQRLTYSAAGHPAAAADGPQPMAIDAMNFHSRGKWRGSHRGGRHGGRHGDRGRGTSTYPGGGRHSGSFQRGRGRGSQHRGGGQQPHRSSYPAQQQHSNSVTCYYCGKYGHMAKDCRKKAADQGNQHAQ